MGKDAGSKSEDVPGGGTYYLRSVPVARLGRATFEKLIIHKTIIVHTIYHTVGSFYDIRGTVHTIADWWHV